MIHLQHAAFVYQAPDGEVEALRDVSFDVVEGEFCSIVGPSGCGKSTLLSALAGLEPLSGGVLTLDGEPVSGPSRKVGFMPQRDQLFEWRTIRDNVTLGLAIRHELTPERLARVDTLLARYGLAEFAAKRPAQLSGGMRQRCALIRTLAPRPEGTAARRAIFGAGLSDAARRVVGYLPHHPPRGQDRPARDARHLRGRQHVRPGLCAQPAAGGREKDV